MSKLYLVCQKIDVKTYNFTVITSSIWRLWQLQNMFSNRDPVRSLKKGAVDKVLQIPYQDYNKTFSRCKKELPPPLIFFEYNCNTQFESFFLFFTAKKIQ